MTNINTSHGDSSEKPDKPASENKGKKIDTKVHKSVGGLLAETSRKLGQFIEEKGVSNSPDQFSEQLKKFTDEDLMLLEDLIVRADRAASMESLHENLEAMTDEAKKKHREILTFCHMIGYEGMHFNSALTNTLRDQMKERGVQSRSGKRDSWYKMTETELRVLKKKLEKDKEELWRNLPGDRGGQGIFKTLEYAKYEMVRDDAQSAQNTWLDIGRRKYDEMKRKDLEGEQKKLEAELEELRVKNRKPDGLYDVGGPGWDRMQEIHDQLYLIRCSLDSIYRTR